MSTTLSWPRGEELRWEGSEGEVTWDCIEKIWRTNLPPSSMAFSWDKTGARGTCTTKEGGGFRPKHPHPLNCSPSIIKKDLVRDPRDKIPHLVRIIVIHWNHPLLETLS
jgi:hypothetical protein